MKWLLLFLLVVSVSYQPLSGPKERNDLAKPIDDIVVKLDTISDRLNGISNKIEEL